MLLKPFNQETLWKGEIQKNHKPSLLRQPEMILPKINSLTGHYTPQKNPSIQQELAQQYEDYSKAYWLGVKQRQAYYRYINRLS